VVIFRQLFDRKLSIYTYLLTNFSTHEAVMINAVFKHVKWDCELIRELCFRLFFTLKTHLYANHVTGAAMPRG